MADDIEQLAKAQRAVDSHRKARRDGNAGRRRRARSQQSAGFDFVFDSDDASRENLDDETKEKLKLISTQITRITQVTRDMMDFARVRPAAKSAVDINSILSKRACAWRVLINRFQNLDLKKDFSGKSAEGFRRRRPVAAGFSKSFIKRPRRDARQAASFR